ncbi:MAG: hypothetical protein PVI40_05275 [Chlamydiota bacterium]|jgi:opacity protein-like surface antigen
MIHYIQKFSFFAFLFFLILGSTAIAEDNKQKKNSDKPIGIYFGGFGGWGYFTADVAQKGTAFIPASSGGDLNVNAIGKSKNNEFGFGGLHIGYEWLSNKDKSWSITPGVELEGYYFSKTSKANLENSSIRLDFHEFADSFPMRIGVVVADGILALTNDYIVPYIGIGIGAGIISIHDADSEQTDPPEPGVNHFNSDPDAFDWSFAVQAKGGLRYQLFKYMRLFAEYRFLYVSPTNYTFGSTQYPDHVPTSNWDVRFSKMYTNLFSAGIDFTF